MTTERAIGHPVTISRGGASHPLVELTMARLREFVREPEAIFWAVVFPIVMSLALAVAFPARGSQPVRVGVAQGPNADAVRRTLGAAPGIIVRDIGADEERAIREGEVHLVVVPTDPPTYRFDSARDESRVARAVVDDAQGVGADGGAARLELLVDDQLDAEERHQVVRR